MKKRKNKSNKRNVIIGGTKFNTGKPRDYSDNPDPFDSTDGENGFHMSTKESANTGANLTSSSGDQKKLEDANTDRCKLEIGEKDYHFVFEKETVNNIDAEGAYKTEYPQTLKDALDAANAVKAEGCFPNCEAVLNGILEKCKYTFKPFDFQKENVMMMLRRFEANGVFGDQVGLGKTIEALLTALVLHEYGVVNRILIVATAQTKDNWQEEAKKLVFYNDSNSKFESPFEFVKADTLDELLGNLYPTESTGGDDQKLNQKLKVFIATHEQFLQNKKITRSFMAKEVSDLSEDERIKSFVESFACQQGDGEGKGYAAFFKKLISELERIEGNNGTVVADRLKKFGYCLEYGTDEHGEWKTKDPMGVIEDSRKSGSTNGDSNQGSDYNIFDLYGGRKEHSDFSAMLFFPEKIGDKDFLWIRLPVLKFLRSYLKSNRFTEKFIKSMEGLASQNGLSGIKLNSEFLVKIYEQNDQSGYKVYIPAVESYRNVLADLDDRIKTAEDQLKSIKNKDKLLFEGVDLLVVDESNELLGETGKRSKIYEYILNVNRRYTIFLSATPIRSGLEDVFKVLYLVNPKRFGDSLREAEDYFYGTVCRIDNRRDQQDDGSVRRHYLQEMARDDEKRRALAGMLDTFFTRRRVADLAADMDKFHYSKTKKNRNNVEINSHIKQMLGIGDDKICPVGSDKICPDGFYNSSNEKETLLYKEIKRFNKIKIKGYEDNWTINIDGFNFSANSEHFNSAALKELNNLVENPTTNKKWNVSVLMDYVDMSRHKKQGNIIEIGGNNIPNNNLFKKIIDEIIDDSTPYPKDNILLFVEKEESRGKIKEEFEDKGYNIIDPEKSTNKSTEGNAGNNAGENATGDTKPTLFVANKNTQKGVNLQEYGKLIYYPQALYKKDPIDIEQWIGRIYRTGQVRETVYVYVVLNSGDDKSKNYFDLLNDKDGLDLFGQGAPEVSFIQPIVTDYLGYVYDKLLGKGGRFTDKLGNNEYTFKIKEDEDTGENYEVSAGFAKAVEPYLDKKIEIEGLNNIGTFNCLKEIVRYFCKLEEFNHKQQG